MQEEKYLEAYRQLNSQQREAVDCIEGPVMVVAGPGTGKTQVVAMRIAQILRLTQMEPRNILALTFTDAGATALRERLVALIGPAGYQVSTNTFHSFAGEIINTFSYCFAFADELKQIDEVSRLKLIKNIVARRADLKYLRPPRSPNFMVRKIADAIKTLKQESISSKRLLELADAERNELDGLTLAKRTLRQAQIDRNIELADIFSQYQQELALEGWYDYEDIINFLANGLETNAEIRAYCQERYQYILVDEFQDSNNAQNRIVELLAGFFTSPNLCVVGDDKQAIYRFQGASVANMFFFYKKYPDLKLIILRKNYRSSAKILSCASSLIENNQQQIANYLPNIKPVRLQSVYRAGPAPRLAVHNTEEDELLWLERAISAQRKKGLCLKEIAVLTRTNLLARQAAKFLVRAGLAVNAKLAEDWLEEPAVKHMLLILKAINDPSDNSVMAPALKVLTSVENLSELLSVISQASQLDQPIISVLERDGTEAVRKVVYQILSWHQQMAVKPLVELVEEVVAFYLRQDITISALSYEIRSLAELLNSAKAAAVLAETPLGKWLDDLQLMRVYKLAQTKDLNSDPEGIFVSTVHGAKGLEFTSVYMIGTSENYWSTAKKREIIVLPNEIVPISDWRENLIEDERRLFYVGLTRAKLSLFLSYAKFSSQGQEVLPCQFLTEIQSHLRPTTSRPKRDRLVFSSAERNKETKGLTEPELRLIRQIIKERPFSATDMATYLACPRRYLLQQVYRFPSPQNYSLMFGNAIHRALERFSRLIKAKKQLPPKIKLQELFSEVIRDEPLGENMEAALGRGKSILAGYYDKFASSWQPSLALEYNFRPHHVMLEDVWITGKCDRIDLIDPIARSVRIIDYKTGSRGKSMAEIKGETKNSRPDMWWQLLFYAVLAKNDPLFPYQAQTFSLVFVDDQQKFPVRDFVFSGREIKEMEQMIVRTWHEILNRTDFPHLGQDDDQGCWLCRLLG